MKKIEFSKQERDVIVGKIKTFMEDEIGQEIGAFDAGFLLDFMTQEIGPYYYNRGLYDAHAILEKRLATITGAILDLEEQTGLRD